VGVCELSEPTKPALEQSRGEEPAAASPFFGLSLLGEKFLLLVCLFENFALRKVRSAELFRIIEPFELSYPLGSVLQYQSKLFVSSFIANKTAIPSNY
jgi:hypothetical protein